MPLPPFFRLQAEIADALAGKRPVVALESSIIAHGFPPPDNLLLAHELAAAVRAEGAVPAMVALLDGEVRIGLDGPALERLAAGQGVAKCSARDIGALLARKAAAGTTVAATARLARAAGITVFATGGIGGVHRREPGAGGPDISADLIELSRVPLAVVSAGAKSILDLPATWEALETLSVAVIGYRCGEFPAFHSAASGIALGHRCEDLDSLSLAVAAHLALAAGAVLVCNPPPAAAAIPAAEVEGWIAQALAEAARHGVAGQGVTPYLLARLDQLSGGRSRIVNRALALDNARLGAALAGALLRRTA